MDLLELGTSGNPPVYVFVPFICPNLDTSNLDASSPDMNKPGHEQN
jgi:hypothetical protein